MLGRLACCADGGGGGGGGGILAEADKGICIWGVAAAEPAGV